MTITTTKHTFLYMTFVTPRTHDQASPKQIDNGEPSPTQIAHRRPLAMQTFVSTLLLFVSGRG